MARKVKCPECGHQFEPGTSFDKTEYQRQYMKKKRQDNPEYGQPKKTSKKGDQDAR